MGSEMAIRGSTRGPALRGRPGAPAFATFAAAAPLLPLRRTSLIDPGLLPALEVRSWSEGTSSMGAALTVGGAAHMGPWCGLAAPLPRIAGSAEHSEHSASCSTAASSVCGDGQQGLPWHAWTAQLSSGAFVVRPTGTKIRPWNCTGSVAAQRSLQPLQHHHAGLADAASMPAALHANSTARSNASGAVLSTC